MVLDPNIRILIADDIAVMRGALKALLGRHGLTGVDEASNGEDAFKMFSLGRYDLVMLDIDMPKMTGMEVLQKIRQSNPTVYVIMVSAHSSVENVKEAVAHGVNAFVVKPYTAKKIESVMGKFARERGKSIGRGAVNV